MEFYRSEQSVLPDPVKMKRILVIGCPGAGKSTFARKLRDLTGLPLYYLDRIYHRADRTTVSREEFDAALQQIMETDRWIIDGNYQRTLEMRLKECDTVFFLDYPLKDCLRGAASRVGTVREDMPWVESEFDPEFRQYILDFPKEQLPGIYELIERYRSNVKIFTFHTREDADEWISSSIIQ